MNEDQRKVVKLRDEIARKIKAGEEVPNKLLSHNLIYGMKNVRNKTKQMGFTKVTSQTQLLNQSSV